MKNDEKSENKKRQRKIYVKNGRIKYKNRYVKKDSKNKENKR